MKFVFSGVANHKKNLIHLQWVLVLCISYLLLFKHGEVVQDPRAFSLVLALLLSALVLYRLSGPVFDHKLFLQALVVFDTILISVAIALNRDNPWDYFLVFFFGLLIAAIGQSFLTIIIGCFIVSTISVFFDPLSTMDLRQLDRDLVFRIPFIFVVSVLYGLYGYLAEQAKKEKERAQKADETQILKRQLVSALAHDIKNPLGTIMGYAETVSSSLVDVPEAKDSLEPLQRIRDNAARIAKLVAGFLDASKVESGKVEFAPHPVQLNNLLKEVGQQQMGDMQKKNISLAVDLDDSLPEIMGDEAQLDRVLWNLVSNAIKFTPREGVVTLKSWVEDRKVCVSVQDTGMGIPKDELPSLFSEFRRLRGSVKVDGTGLGLFIVKTIAEAHGATVSAESQEGKGSAFTVRFPIGRNS